MTLDNSTETPLVLLSNRYRVLNVLGDGGFGQTFLVEDTHMPSNKRCVLKQLKPIHERPELKQMVRDRFQREAAILETLGESHTQIPRLYAYFSEGDQFYLVEEWVEGITLSQKVHKEGALSEQTVQAIITNLLPAVAYVHNRRIVHRDIKPDNIILRASDGKPVLIDFGAVKETMKTIINSGEQSTHSIVVGTPGYMPSEQLSGRPIYASDIYSLGMTAIFLLTGKIPQELDTDPQTGSLSWREHASGISPEFADFLDRATHMSPQSRFATIPEMQSALNTILMGQMGTQVSANAVTSHPPGAANNLSGETQSPPVAGLQSSQTVVSQPNALQPNAPQPNSSQTVISTTPVVAAGTGGVNSGPQTAVVSPLASPQSPTAQQPVSTAYQQSAGDNSSGQWKGAVIVGGMVGLSILVGAFVMTEGLPKFGESTNKPETNKPDVVETVAGTDEEAPVNPDTQRDQPSELDEASETPAETTPTPPVQAAAPPVQSAPSVPGANGSVVGTGGTKNIRSGAGTGFSVVDQVAIGNRIRVIDRANDSEGYPWYRVVTPSGTKGWIAGQLIQIDGDAPLPTGTTTRTPTTPTPPRNTTPSANATIVSNESGSKNVRSGPGTGFGVQHEAYPGDRIRILDSAQDAGGYTWYRVFFPESGAEGWIAAQLVRRD
ncbi:MAG: SH3 domain-containing protein [Cyanobacteria bacterium J06560_6]